MPQSLRAARRPFCLGFFALSVAIAGCGGKSQEGKAVPPKTTSIATGYQLPHYVRVLDGVVYFNDAAAGDERIFRVAREGGTVVQMAATSGVFGLDVTASGLYWQETPRQAPPLPQLTVFSVPLSGGMATTVLSDAVPGQALVVRGTSLYWRRSGSTSDSLVLADERAGQVSTVVDAGGILIDFSVTTNALFWTTQHARQIGRSDLGVSGTTNLPTAEEPILLTADDSALYYTTVHPDGTKSLWKMDRESGRELPLIANLASAGPLAEDAQFVYFVEASEGTIKKVPKAGGAPTTLAALGESASLVDMAVDDKYVYVSNASGRSIERAAK